MFTVTYKDCIRAAAFYLKLEDVIAAIDSNKIDTAAESAKKEIEELRECLDLVIDEIACDYVPLKKIENLKSEDNRIYFVNFERQPADIFSIKNGKTRVPYRVFFDSVLMPYEGRFEVEYSYMPIKGGLETNLEWDSARVGERVVGYGIACEYCIINGMADEAALWDKRFKDALFKDARVKRQLIIKKRRWY